MLIDEDPLLEVAVNMTSTYLANMKVDDQG